MIAKSVHGVAIALAALAQLPAAQAYSVLPSGAGPNACPVACSDNSAFWTRYRGFDQVKTCQEPLIFALNLHLEELDSSTAVFACSLSSSAKLPEDIELLQQHASSGQSLAASKEAPPSVHDNCNAKVGVINATIVTGSSAGNLQRRDDKDAHALNEAMAQIGAYQAKFASCGSTTLFAKAGDHIAGYYAGADVQPTGTASFLQQLGTTDTHGYAQVCNETTTLDTTVGIIGGTLDMNGIATVQKALRTWSAGKCVGISSSPASSKQYALHVLQPSISENNAGNSSSTLRVNNSTAAVAHARRGYCRDTPVLDQDSCAKLADRCGISGYDFTQYNKDVCATLQPGQYVCCSSGELQDHRPQPQSDGTCAVHKADAGFGCFQIAQKFGISVDDIESFNKKTWGWAGCSRMQKDQLMCLSRGNPPFPGPITGTMCGPQVPGTVKPAGGKTDYSDLNPCKLNSCCDVWGFCGVSPDFCTPSPADTGAPGTARPGTNGCISNCGLDIKSSDPPASFMKVAYFESWNWQRHCLHRNVNDLGGGYTHIHFAFATVSSPDWKVVIDDRVKAQFEQFKGLKGVKRILSFGGWAFSTDQATYQTFRNAVKPENKDTFAANCADFLKEHGLDGLDFDWEYPGAPDIPDIPPGSPDEGALYLGFLATLKKVIPSGTTLSIALPSSFWYLQGYPIQWLQYVTDYFIYMTYDLHGQWDYNNKWSSPGCPSGNCIRSHINSTETQLSLAMITKAGVASNKIVVGVASYGRSFRLADGGCTTPDCLFTGTPVKSNAFTGHCTSTSGYISNAELREIREQGMGYSDVHAWYDRDSDSNIMTYSYHGMTDWVAYMDDDVKQKRTDKYKGLHFAGTTDWAVDLGAFAPNDGGNEAGTEPPDTSDRDKYICENRRSLRVSGNIHTQERVPLASSFNSTISIVNLTPYNFKLDVERTHANEYKIEFYDVPAGRAMPNLLIQYPKKYDVDQNAEAYYKVEGTDYTFVVKLRNNNKWGTFQRVIFDMRGMGLGSREYQIRPAAQLVITGSEQFGFYTSMRVDGATKGWMKTLLPQIGDRKLSQVMMAGSHDAAMSEWSHKLLSLDSAALTQTQALNIGDQARSGSRYFDLRIGSVEYPDDGRAFYGMHVNEETAQVAIGNTGASLGSIIDSINSFTAENPGEILIFKVRYLIGIRQSPFRGPIYWNQATMNKFLDMMAGVNNLCKNLEKNIAEYTVSELSNMNGGKGCVIFLLNPTRQNPDDFKDSYPELGFYPASKLDMDDRWPNTDNSHAVIAMDIANWSGRDGQDNKFIIGQWITSSHGAEVPNWHIEERATTQINPYLYWAGIEGMSKTAYPNVLLLDYIGENVAGDSGTLNADMSVLAMGVNLMLLSENCGITTKVPPLTFDPTKKRDVNATAALLPLRPRDDWNGIIFANGTVIDDPPADFEW